MGASCSRWDCAVVVEDCTSKGPRPGLFYDCAGQQLGNNWGSSSSRERDWDSTELVAPQEAEVQLVCDRFAVCRSSRGSLGGGGAEWRRRYVLGRELGAGQTAIVFEAFSAGPGAEEAAGNGRNGYLGGPCSSGSPCRGGPTQRKSTGRRVALKRFYNPGTMMFQQELLALTRVGVHPHILRLLESYEGGNDEDVLVLEHCDGGDVYELYAANNGCCMLEAFVLQLLRQLLLAVEHLVERGVEHRDVKPENLLLYGSSMDTMAVPRLKLADFGWAVVVDPKKGQPSVPPEGVGSLWYAPPELNPPVDGVPLSAKDSPLGRSDMWSVGIITYLLLVGHSPFNPALRVADPLARENEVIRLAALGRINTTTRPWACLSEEARSFVTALIQPEPGKRLSPSEAWNHPFLARLQDGYEAAANQVPAPLAPEAERCERWKRLDGFQRLCWLALARAVAEPELLEVPGVLLFVDQQSIGSTMYLDQLAVELAVAAVPQWFQQQAAFSDVFLLAFHYLDCDSDGMLSATDLVEHVVGEDAKVATEYWVGRWGEASSRAARGLDFAAFCRALAASCEGLTPRPEGSVKHVPAVDLPEPPREPPEASVEGAAAAAAEAGGEAAAAGVAAAGGPTAEAASRPVLAKGRGDVVLEKRMQAIDEVCQRFLDEEFDDFGYGF